MNLSPSKSSNMGMGSAKNVDLSKSDRVSIFNSLMDNSEL